MNTRRLWTVLAVFTLGVALVACGDEDDLDGGPGGMDSGPPGVDAGPGDTDAGPGDTDAGPGDTDAGPGDTDAGPGDTDAGPVMMDAGPMCSPITPGGGCMGGLTCECCPAGGPAMNCVCTTRCSSDLDCTDPARPHCNRPSGAGGRAPGICTTLDYRCLWGAACASPDTPILTPDGERRIDALEAGDLVMTMHEGALVARPLVRVSQTPVTNHAVVHVELATGATLEVTGIHPTADGRLFSDLVPGGELDGVTVEAVRTVPYAHSFTHDILPDSDTGSYVAGGVLIGTTLSR